MSCYHNKKTILNNYLIRMISNMHKLIISIFAISLINNCSAVKIQDAKVEQSIDTIIPIVKKALKKIKIPGGYLVVTRKNKIMCVQSFGNTTISTNNPKPVDNYTLFPIASCSKTVTAYLIGALVDDGKIKWKDKIRKYYKDFFLHNEELSNELTIQDLVSHSTGFKHFSGDSLWGGGYPYNAVVNLFKYIKQVPGSFRQTYGYQNIIFGLIGQVLEKATGEKYEDLVKKYIFDKIDMKHSSAIDLKYETSRINYVKYLASRFKYDINKNGFFSTIWNFIKSTITFKPKAISLCHSRYNDAIYPVDPKGHFHRFPATAGIALSANDFAKFVQMILNGGVYNNKTIVKKDTFNKITSGIVKIIKVKDDDEQFKIERFPREDMYYGIGTFVTKYGDNGKNTRKILFHMGGTCGATSFYLVSPEDEIGVACVVNFGGTTNSIITEYMCTNFLDLCLDFKGIDWIQADIDRTNKAKQLKQNFENNFKKVLAPMAHIEKYVGTYTSDIYGDINIALNKNNKLVLSNGIQSTELQHLNGSIFKFPNRNLLTNYFDSDEYISFRFDEFKNINSFFITCFSEGDTIFKRKDEKINDSNKK